MSAFGTAALVLAFVVGVGVIVWVLVFGILLFVDYDRGMRMLGGLAMFVRSVKKKPVKDTPHRHQRAGEEEPREHKRKTPASPPTIRMFATPAPQRRASDEKPEPEETET